MSFLQPEYLIFMLIPTVILFYFVVTHVNKIDSIFDAKILKKLRYDNDSLGRVGRNIMLFMALFFMIVALARPVFEKGEIKTKSKSIDLMVALDISKSMLATDFYPNRLEFAKKEFSTLVDSFPQANIGVIAFSSGGFLVSPMTQDGTTLKYLVDNLSLDSMSLKGTDLMIPIKKGNSFLKDAKEKIVVIFSDGGDKKDFSDEIKKAKEYGESIYIYATATPIGSPIKENGESIKDKNGNIVISRLNDSIKNLSLETNGAYIIGDYKGESIRLMIDDIKKKFKMKNLKEKIIKEYQELFYYPLSIAVLFLLFAFSSIPKRGVKLLLIAFLFSNMNIPLEAKVFDFFDIKDAKEAYIKGDFNTSTTLYESIVQSKKSAESFYDLANSRYKSGDYESALDSFEKVDPKNNISLEYKKYFNIGNSYFNLKKYDEAIKSYEKAKKIKSEEDLDFNIELAKKMKKKQEEENQKKDKEKQDKKEDQKEKDQKKKDNKDSDSKKDQDQKKGDKSDKKDKQKPTKEQQQKEEAKKSSDREEKMWQEQLEKMKPKTMPMQFKTEKFDRRREDENPW
jgi:Ca-activated chloride channel family protein